MTGGLVARMFPAQDGGWWLETPYVAEFVAELKGFIRYPLRRWDPERRLWWVHSSCQAMALQLLRRHFDVVEVLDGEPAKTLPSDPYETLYLLPTAPTEVVRAAYRALSKLHHPDHGGDTAGMQRINAAYEALMAEVKHG